MKRVAVIAHAGKTLDGGLTELRRELGRLRHHRARLARGAEEPRRRRSRCGRPLEAGAELVIVWGGDGMVQRCVDVLAGTKATLAIIPAGTANLLATNLGIPKDLKAAVAIALGAAAAAGSTWAASTARRFAVMAGAGFDARMIGAADGPLKDRFGRLAYVWTGRAERPRGAVRGDGSRSTASAGTGARRAASWSATWASCSAASRRSRRPTRRRLAGGRRGDRRRRRGVDAHHRPGRDRHGLGVAVHARRRRRRRSGSASTGRCRTSSTAATARRCGRCEIQRRARRAIRVCVPGDAAAAQPPESLRVWRAGGSRAVLVLGAAAGDRDAWRRARRAAARRSSCRTSGRRRMRQGAPVGRMPASRASSRVMRARATCSAPGSPGAHARASGLRNGEQTTW